MLFDLYINETVDFVSLRMQRRPRSHLHPHTRRRTPTTPSPLPALREMINASLLGARAYQWRIMLSLDIPPDEIQSSEL
ncbi:hypothetical protein GOP47_0007513 [Adiantum capillus-veneris]|uniref:Uncharacterized protein n=1 Tax=Adiantum capillus-veneris TaxID=13818 RepID=A0A9D4V166_ADICA|nr:hypothetical protein GOP47_0007513 [Adiantum capillus-veneris]